MSKRLVFAALVILSASGAAACGSVLEPEVATQTGVQFASRIQQNGSAWRSFVVPTAGTVTVQLTSVTTADAVLELGLGTLNGTNCVVTQKIQTAANSTASSPQITATLSQGNYCVQVKDVGLLTTIVDFTVLVITPI